LRPAINFKFLKKIVIDLSVPLINTIPYSLSTETNGIEQLAKAFYRITGGEFSLQNNKIVIPNYHGTGNIDFFELSEGLALARFNCSFHKAYVFKRIPSLTNTHYCILFNFSGDNGVRFDLADQISKEQNDEHDFLLVTSSLSRVNIHIPAHAGFKCTAIIFSEAWLKMKVGKDEFQFKEIAKNGKLRKQIIKACLFAFTDAIKNGAKNMIDLQMEDEAILQINGDVNKVIALKHIISENLQEELPTVAEAAAKCFMSRAKFARLFKDIFKTPYALFFWNLRLERATGLLMKDYTVKNVSALCGYRNVSNFSSAFKKKYKRSPVDYRVFSQSTQSFKSYPESIGLN
jgi:AraC-like DNA-binding protein